MAWPTRAGQFSVYRKDGFAERHRRTTAILMRYGFHVVELPLQAHPDIPPGGIPAGPRSGPMYAMLERDAREAGLELNWPPHLPDTRRALAAAEWVRRHRPDDFPAVHRKLFEAHFVLGEGLEDPAVIDSRARADRALISQRCMPPLPMAAQ